jgi:hypothetical protein
MNITNWEYLIHMTISFMVGMLVGCVKSKKERGGRDMKSKAEQLAEELYPILDTWVSNYRASSQNEVAERERAAWLSRQKEVDELKRQLDSKWVEYEYVCNQLAAKEKEHDAEMCAFAEWVGCDGWIYSSNHKTWGQVCDISIEEPHTTSELLKQFRNDK